MSVDASVFTSTGVKVASALHWSLAHDRAFTAVRDEGALGVASSIKTVSIWDALGGSASAGITERRWVHAVPTRDQVAATIINHSANAVSTRISIWSTFTHAIAADSVDHSVLVTLADTVWRDAQNIVVTSFGSVLDSQSVSVLQHSTSVDRAILDGVGATHIKNSGRKPITPTATNRIGWVSHFSLSFNSPELDESSAKRHVIWESDIDVVGAGHCKWILRPSSTHHSKLDASGATKDVSSFAWGEGLIKSRSGRGRIVDISVGVDAHKGEAEAVMVVTDGIERECLPGGELRTWTWRVVDVASMFGCNPVTRSSNSSGSSALILPSVLDGGGSKQRTGNCTVASDVSSKSESN